MPSACHTAYNHHPHQLPPYNPFQAVVEELRPPPLCLLLYIRSLPNDPGLTHNSAALRMYSAILNSVDFDRWSSRGALIRISLDGGSTMTLSVDPLRQS